MNHLAHNITPGFFAALYPAQHCHDGVQRILYHCGRWLRLQFCGDRRLIRSQHRLPHTIPGPWPSGIMLATGGSAVCARQMGQGDDQGAKHSFSLLLFCGAAIGLLMAVGWNCLCRPNRPAAGLQRRHFPVLLRLYVLSKPLCPLCHIAGDVPVFLHHRRKTGFGPGRHIAGRRGQHRL